MRRFRLNPLQASALTSAALALGCSATFRSPADGGPEWIEVSTEHFVVQSDLPEAEASEPLAELETFRAALEQTAFPARVQPRDTTFITLFAREDEYRDLGPANTVGFYCHNRWPFYAPRVVVSQGSLEDFQRRIQHEIVHHYVAFHVPNAPAWLNEGLAEFYSTLKVSGRRVTGNGAPQPQRRGCSPGARSELRKGAPPARRCATVSRDGPSQRRSGARARSFHGPRRRTDRRRRGTEGTSDFGRSGCARRRALGVRPCALRRARGVEHRARPLAVQAQGRPIVPELARVDPAFRPRSSSGTISFMARPSRTLGRVVPMPSQTISEPERLFQLFQHR